MEAFGSLLEKIDNFIWGAPVLILILAVGIFLTVLLKGLQIRHLPKALKYMFQNEEGTEGEISSFGALCTALSATIGTGNIVGVATAIGVLAGGPGALFWMWIAALLGMATKYAEGFLAVKYRTVDKEGHVLGGPFYYIENGMGARWKWMAKIFAFFGAATALFGIGTMTQVNGIATAIQSYYDPQKVHVIKIFGMEYTWAVVITACVLTVCVGLILIGGIKRIAGFSGFIVPFMTVLYIVSVVLVIIVHADRLPMAFREIFEGAFGLRSVSGGVFASMFIAMQKGVARGVFSNEAGLGSAPIAAAAAKTKEPVRQGLVSMTGTFIDTVVLCTMTGLCIIMMGSWKNGAKEGIQVTSDAFEKGLDFLPKGLPSYLLMLCLVFFAFTTIIGWNYYGERCLEYISNRNQNLLKLYRILYLAAVFAGPYLTVSAVWTIADIFNGLMAIPNIIALFALSGVIKKETDDYFRRMKKV